MPRTTQPFSRRRCTSGAKSLSDEAITTTSGLSDSTRSMASTAIAMSVLFLPAARLTMGLMPRRLKAAWLATALSAVQ